MATKKLKINKKTVTKLNADELKQIDGGVGITYSLACPSAIQCITQSSPPKCGSVAHEE